MSAAEIHSRAFQALYEGPEGPGDDDMEAERGSASPGRVDRAIMTEGPGLADTELDVSAVPVLDDSAVSSIHADDSGAGPHEKDSSGSADMLSSGNQAIPSAPDSGHNSSAGALVFIIRVLLAMNFFLSISFFAYLS